MALLPPILGREATLYLVAQQFLTRLPTPGWIDYEPGGLARAARYFPLVGLVVGALAAALWLIIAPVTPAPVAAGLALGFLIFVTGALHEDGFADCCDGLGGGASREKALAIMRDSRIGAYGAIGLVMTIGLRWTSLSGLDLVGGAIALVLAPVLGRVAMVILLAFGAYARADGAARDVKDGVTKAELAIALALSTAIALVFAGLTGLFALFAVLAAAALKCMGGQMYGKLVFRNEDEAARAKKAGIKNFDRVYTRDDMVTGDVIFAATGVTDGSILPGIKREPGVLTAETILMRAKTGSVRRMTYRHPLGK